MWHWSNHSVQEQRRDEHHCFRHLLLLLSGLLYKRMHLQRYKPSKLKYSCPELQLRLQIIFIHDYEKKEYLKNKNLN